MHGGGDGRGKGRETRPPPHGLGCCTASVRIWQPALSDTLNAAMVRGCGSDEAVGDGLRIEGFKVKGKRACDNPRGANAARRAAGIT